MLLCVASQGLGDSIMMARYLPWLATQTDALTVMVQPSLVRLFERQAAGRWTVVPEQAEPPEHEAWVDLMSLPYHHGTTLDTIPAPADFDFNPQSCDLDTAMRLARSAFQQEAPRVALCAQGGNVASLDLDRSDHTGSLAGGFWGLPAHVADWTGMTGDWLDTAEELATYDLLISVDSALAHLAGSLGVETWLVPPTHWEWRWLDPRAARDRGLDPDRSLWYPDTHWLFRRAHTNDWPGVTARIRRALAQRLAMEAA